MSLTYPESIQTVLNRINNYPGKPESTQRSFDTHQSLCHFHFSNFVI